MALSGGQVQRRARVVVLHTQIQPLQQVSKYKQAGLEKQKQQVIVSERKQKYPNIHDIASLVGSTVCQNQRHSLVSAYDQLI